MLSNWDISVYISFIFTILEEGTFTLLKALLIVQTLLWTCGEDFAVKHPNFWWRDRLCVNCKCLSIYLEWYLIRFRSVNAPSLNILWTCEHLFWCWCQNWRILTKTYGSSHVVTPRYLIFQYFGKFQCPIPFRLNLLCHFSITPNRQLIVY